MRRFAEAERWARSAAEKAFESDLPSERAATKLQLAKVLATGGRHEEALAQAADALQIHEAKGDQPGASTVRRFLEELEPGS